jgi:hypothetical protein
VSNILGIYVASAHAAFDGQLVVDAGRQLVDARREHGVLTEAQIRDETHWRDVEEITMPLIFFSVSTLSMKSLRSNRPAKPASPYLRRGKRREKEIGGDR